MTAKPYQKEDDADLEDLLVVDESTKEKRPKTSNKTPKYYDYTRATTSNKANITNLCSMACTLLLYSFLTYKKTGAVLTVLVVAFILYAITVGLVTKNEEVGVSHYDMSMVTSTLDFDIGSIDHWCIHGGDVKCRCEDPLIPTPRLNHNWVSAYKFTTSLLPPTYDPYMPLYADPKPVDIAFLGQSVVEVMNGRIMGQEVDRPLEQHARSMFQKRYGPEADVNGVALGIAGDSAATILYRLQHGYLPNTSFDPYVWWIVIGMEDLGKWGCSEDVVVMGVLRIVEEIQKERPYAKVVINSLFPMTTLRSGHNDENEFEDAEHPPRNGGHRQLPQGIPMKEWKKMSKEERQEIKKINAEKKKYEDDIKKDKVNPTMKDTHKIKNRDFWLRKKDVNLWPSVHTINLELKKFAGENPNVKYFDSTAVFAEQKNGKDYTLLTDKISPRGHPTEEGFHDWLDAVGKSSAPLIKEQREIYNDEDDDLWSNMDFQGDDMLPMYGYDDIVNEDYYGDDVEEEEGEDDTEEIGAEEDSEEGTTGEDAEADNTEEDAVEEGTDSEEDTIGEDAETGNTEEDAVEDGTEDESSADESSSESNDE